MFMSRKFFVYHVTGSIYSRIIFPAIYILRKYKTLKGIGKIQYVSELTILLNL